MPRLVGNMIQGEGKGSKHEEEFSIPKEWISNPRYDEELILESEAPN